MQLARSSIIQGMCGLKLIWVFAKLVNLTGSWSGDPSLATSPETPPENYRGESAQSKIRTGDCHPNSWVHLRDRGHLRDLTDALDVAGTTRPRLLSAGLMNSRSSVDCSMFFGACMLIILTASIAIRCCSDTELK